MKKIFATSIIVLVISLFVGQAKIFAFWPFDSFKTQGKVMGETTTNTTDVMAVNEYLSIINEACNNISSSQTAWQPYGNTTNTDAANSRRYRQEMNTLTNSVISKCKDIKSLTDKIISMSKKMGYDILPYQSNLTETNTYTSPTPTKGTAIGSCKRGADGTCCEKGVCNSAGSCMWTCCTRTTMTMSGGSKQGNSKCVSSVYEKGKSPLVE